MFRQLKQTPLFSHPEYRKHSFIGNERCINDSVSVCVCVISVSLVPNMLNEIIHSHR